jgi:hypothetical protein
MTIEWGCHNKKEYLKCVGFVCELNKNCIRIFDFVIWKFMAAQRIGRGRASQRRLIFTQNLRTAGGKSSII